MNFLRRSPGAIHKQRRSLDSIQYNSSQESLTTPVTNNKHEDSADDGKDDNQSRRSSFSGKVPTIQESDENRPSGCRQDSTGFDLPEDDPKMDNVSLDSINQNVGSVKAAEEWCQITGNESDNSTPTRARILQNNPHQNSVTVDSADSEKCPENPGSDGREDTTPDRLLPSPDTDVAQFRNREMSFDKSFDNLFEKLNSEKPANNQSQSSLNKLDTKSSNGGSDRETPGKVSPDDIVVTVTKPSKVEKKKKSSMFTVLSPTYKSKTDDFKKLFKDIPSDERLIVDYSCALQKDILVHGRMFITQNWLCFYANIFRWETVLTIPIKDITAITKEKTARVIPNAVQITTQKDKYFFTSFAARDKTFLMLFRIWQNALLAQPMSPKELWHWVHFCYGEELGLTSSDEDYILNPGSEKHKLRDDSGTGKDLDTTNENGLNVFFEESCNGSVSVASENLSDSHLPMDTPSALRTPDEPTDFGDTTEDSDGIGEVICTCHDHLDKTYMNEIYNLPVDKMFELLFTDSKFFRDFVGTNKTFDLLLPPWQEELDDDGNRLRHIRYTLTLGASFGPKHSPSTEKQICLKQSKPGVMYIIDCHIANGSIPYAESFYTSNRYCITRVSNTRCRLKVTSAVKYRKSVWGLVKNMIEKNAHHGITNYYKNLGIALHKEAGNQNDIESAPITKQQSKKKRRRRRLMANHTDSLESSRQTEVHSVQSSPVRSFKIHREKENNFLYLNVDTLFPIVICVLIFLVLSNAMLFYKLWSLEGIADGLMNTQSFVSRTKLCDFPDSKEDWLRLLEEQRIAHEEEIYHWQEILSTSILLMDQMKSSLMELKKSLNMHYDFRGKYRAESNVPFTGQKLDDTENSKGGMPESEIDSPASDIPNHEAVRSGDEDHLHKASRGL